MPRPPRGMEKPEEKEASVQREAKPRNKRPRGQRRAWGRSPAAASPQAARGQPPGRCAPCSRWLWSRRRSGGGRGGWRPDEGERAVSFWGPTPTKPLHKYRNANASHGKLEAPTCPSAAVRTNSAAHWPAGQRTVRASVCVRHSRGYRHGLATATPSQLSAPGPSTQASAHLRSRI